MRGDDGSVNVAAAGVVGAQTTMSSVTLTVYAPVPVTDLTVCRGRITQPPAVTPSCAWRLQSSVLSTSSPDGPV
jgi:hypothetical protein